jgi:ribosome-associated heat shock protein Hsp15
LQRIDKWLWHARFFKSRTLAATMVSDGRVRINGERGNKPAQTIKAGDVLTFAAGTRVRVIKIVAIGERRGPATEAQTLYEDLDPPKPKSEEAHAEPAPERSARPTKKGRRDIKAFTRRAQEDD